MKMSLHFNQSLKNIQEILHGLMALRNHHCQAAQAFPGWRPYKVLHKTAKVVVFPIPNMPAQSQIFSGPLLKTAGIHKPVILPILIIVMDGKPIVTAFLDDKTVTG